MWLKTKMAKKKMTMKGGQHRCMILLLIAFGIMLKTSKTDGIEYLEASYIDTIFNYVHTYFVVDLATVVLRQPEC